LVSLHIPIAIILLAGGLLACFLGYRLLRVLLAILGFVAGVIASTLFFEQFDTWLAFAITIGCGLLGSLLAIAAYLIGVALCGAALGPVILNAMWVSEVENPSIWLMLGVCLIGALCALALRRYFIMIGTSFGGAWTVIIGILALTGNQSVVSAVNGDIESLYSVVSWSTSMNFWSGWLILGTVALFVQLRTSGRARKVENG